MPFHSVNKCSNLYQNGNDPYPCKLSHIGDSEYNFQTSENVNSSLAKGLEILLVELINRII